MTIGVMVHALVFVLEVVLRKILVGLDVMKVVALDRLLAVEGFVVVVVEYVLLDVKDAIVSAVENVILIVLGLV